MRACVLLLCLAALRVGAAEEGVSAPAPAPEPEAAEAPAQAEPAATSEETPPPELALPVDEAIDGEGPAGEDLEAPPGGPVLALADVQSRFSQGLLRKAKRALDRGDFRGVQRMLVKEEPTPPVRYLRALASARAGDVEALAELQSLADADPLLRPYLLYEAARLQERRRRLQDAVALYAQVGPDNVLYPRVRTTMANHLVRLGRPRQAMKVLSEMLDQPAPALDGRERADTWRRIATLAHKVGARKTELRAQLSLWALHPEHAHGEWARRRLRGVAISLRWRITRAERLVALGRFDDAVRLLKQIRVTKNLSTELTCRATFVQAMVRRKERQHDEVVQLLRPLVERCQEQALHPQLLLALANSEAVLAPPSAVEHYELLAARHAEHPLADDALLHAADVQMVQGQREAALATLQRIPKMAKGDMAVEALFRAARLLREDGRAEQALAMLDRSAHVSGAASSHEQVLRARYWKALTLLELERADEAHTTLEGLAEEAPLSYYGLLARVRLADAEPARAARVVQRWTRSDDPLPVWPMPLGALAQEPLFQLGLELLRLDHPHAPETLLLAVSRARGAGAARLVFHVLTARNYPRYATKLTEGQLGRGMSSSGRGASRLLQARLYPVKYAQLTRRSARSAGVDPLLLQAIVREESGFDPRRRSPVGAVGLTQLMPSTAALVARKMGRPRPSVEALTSPRENLQLGARYFGSLLEQWDGNVVYAVAAYNAGPGAVRSWLRQRPSGDVDSFVEDIPFEETRNYVKRVLGSYSAYQLLYQPRRVKPLLGVRLAATTVRGQR